MTSFQALSATLPPHILAVLKHELKVPPGHVEVRLSINRPNITCCTVPIVGGLGFFATSTAHSTQVSSIILQWKFPKHSFSMIVTQQHLSLSCLHVTLIRSKLGLSITCPRSPNSNLHRQPA
ncbi:hypothetical protein BS17DRAFT_781555 [Gyrodon lividus]|nr:hypothetical protein BS17DRAFT_781555 [Gyrodon lividus]